MGESERAGVEETPTYAVALVALALIAVSLAVERAIHGLKQHLKTKNRKPLRKALDKLTDELMLLGFISLMITGLQSPISKICVPPSFADQMLPCSKLSYDEDLAPAETDPFLGRRLLTYYHRPERRLTEGEDGYCSLKGKVPFVSKEVLHQLDIFIFVLAITHVCYSLCTVLLGFARLHNWREWDEETRQAGYDGHQDLYGSYSKKVLAQRPRLFDSPGQKTAVADKHSKRGCSENPLSLWVLCVFKQFFASVSREDYLTLRVGFVSKHKLGAKFNFRAYVIRSMERDVEVIIGISWWLWLFMVMFMLLNVQGFYIYFWVAFIPTILVLSIGTKQQHIISTLALKAKQLVAETMAKQGEENTSTPVSIDFSTAVSPSDKLFWFDSPTLLLKLIHFIIFQNSFELAIFFWLLTTFGWHSCILGNHNLLIIRLVVGVVTQLLASYSTLPLYALVSQMGSTMKEEVFTENVLEGLKGWKSKVQKLQLNKEKKSPAVGSKGDPRQDNAIGPSKGTATVAPE